MDIISILVIALGLSADCFAVSISGGATQQTFSRVKMFRLAAVFGFFQFIMPVIGWLLGNTVVDLISSYDHWIAFALLLIVGGRMVWESFEKADSERKSTDITRGLILITLALATSIDALAVGLSFAFLNIDIVFSSLIIGIVSFFMTSLGYWIGKKAGGLLGKRAKLVGGIILIAIGIRILIEHLL